ncbi:MAG: NADP oxidoreductase coenzyme F420-dependent [Flavobacterium sp.]|uniref:NADPH-dependent F420 reductase n=1 Tax=Flavobacterium sp. TaxID=239 RepID=UPI0012169BD9|nr:NAD(P)-binding domain-containing protein [Flavobacterium sp.]RZJ66802.1 MAG: NADP oxidoreductase coenzyme F420-dependent [Flavobacterium sp.]
MSTQPKVAVIGLGNIGKVVATNFAKSNRNFIAADRDVSKAEQLSKDWSSATPTDIASAVKAADIVILSIPFEAINDFKTDFASDLEGKIIIDPSNPIAPDEKGGFKKIIAADESAGKVNSKSLPTNAKLVKAFGTLGAASLQNAAFQSPQNVLFYATDDATVNDTVEQLIADSGFAAVRVGDLNNSIRLEVFGDLHEFGALGKTVTVEEAKSKL